MDVICQELGIPRKQIKETKRSGRFIVIVHRSWLQSLVKENVLTSFQIHPGFDEWPSSADSIGREWTLTYFTIYQKFTHKVIPLPNCRKDNSDPDFILNFTQILQNISTSNHRNLWKDAYSKYSGKHTKVPVKEAINRNERNTVNLVAYDTVLMEAIIRTHGCNVLHVKSDMVNHQMEDSMRNMDKKRFDEIYGRFEPHANLYPVLAPLIETNSHFVVIYNNGGDFLENTLADCITYSPAILDKSFNKPLFIIYQLFHLMKTLHDRGLLLGNIDFDDIFITDDLWLQVIPQIDLNILQCAALDFSNETLSENVAQKNSVKYEPMNVPPLLKDVTYSLKNYCEMWCNGQISNFDYLTILNNLSGRRLGDPSFHHIMPWVTDFVSRNGMNWRDLTKSKYRLNKGDTQLDLMFAPSGAANMIPHHVSDGGALSEITYYLYMARRTPKTILCKHVRPIWVPHEYPASIQRLYDWTPDECIPEFFTDPLVFKSIHEDLPDLEIPSWSSCPEDFVARHREALESQTISERLHHWIDLNFGFKLTGEAAIKSKNVHLSIVDNHKNLCRRGIVQLFNHPHPPKQYLTIWTSKTPPRIYSQAEIRQRMTRSTEDLSNKYRNESEPNDSVPGTVNTTESSARTARSRATPQNILDDIIHNSIERSPSLHSNVQKSQNQIILPKDYNPIAALNAVENMEIFLAKTFYKNIKNETMQKMNNDFDPGTTSNSASHSDEGINAFTNKIFSDRFEENLMKDTKRLHNLNHKNLFVQNSTRNYKQIISNHRRRELLVIACIVVELFMANRLRPMGSTGLGSAQRLNDRIEACRNVLKVESLPKCVQHMVKLLFLFGSDESDHQTITDIGLPKPSAHQMLQPFLCNFLFPFPNDYLNVYILSRTLYQYESASQLLDCLTFFENSKYDCRNHDVLIKERTLFERKIAECKIAACSAQIERILVPHGYEQFDTVELILPHIVKLLTTESTSILASWFIFDKAAVALGQNLTQKYLLEPILKLYDPESDDRVKYNSFDSSSKSSSGLSFKSRKTIKLYHHSFLLRLIVRFGLNCFLNNFVPPLIEAIGGCKEINHHALDHYGHQLDNSNISTSTKHSKRNHKMSTTDERLEHMVSKKASDSDEMFTFENESDDLPKSAVNVQLTDTSSDNDVDRFDTNSNDGLRLNHSNAIEVTEETTLSDSGFRLSDLSGLSFEEDQSNEMITEKFSKDTGNLTSPTIPIPSSSSPSSKRNQLNTIDCEIGSKISTEDTEMFIESSMVHERSRERSIATSVSSSVKPSNFSDQQTQYQISDMSAESLIWLSHRLGPVLTARHLSRNLLKMLTLCYIGQENLMPDLLDDGECKHLHDDLLMFTIADGRVSGDKSAVKVLECLTSITTIYGENFILLQYFPHITELIALCKKRLTSNLEGGLISSLQLLKYVVPCLSDAVIMHQLHDTILKNIIHPVIRFIASTRFQMPNGFLARSVLARKLLDALYVLSVRIGPEMTRTHLCVPALQRFFLIFDKAYGISENFGNDSTNDDSRHSPTFEDASFIEIQRDGGTKEWSIKGSPIQITTARSNADNSSDNITPPKQSCDDEAVIEMATTSLRERALEEIKEVFTPQMAHLAYVNFLKYLGDHIMKQFVKNLPLILTLCHEFEQPDYASLGNNSYRRKDSNDKIANENISTADAADIPSSSFGTAMIGNRIEVYKEKIEMGPMELLDLVTHKYDQINTTRHLRGNWLAIWEHEIGQSDKNNHFNFKQIKLQTFAGHANAVRSILSLDNENSFMSASKDKTVKLWALRSEGDGSKISSCQFTYSNHRKSVHSLAFLESLRLSVSCDSSVHIWDPFVGIGDSIGQLELHKLVPVSIVKTFSSPSSLILAGTAESTVKTIDARTLSYVNEWKYSTSQVSGSVRCIAMSPSCTWFAIGLSSGNIIVSDARMGIVIASWKATDSELLQLHCYNEHQLISTSLDHSICVWSALDGSLLYYIKSPNEPVHVLRSNQNELIFGTPANRIGVYASVQPDCKYSSITKLRTETLKGVLTSMEVLPLNRMLLVGNDSGHISLLC